MDRYFLEKKENVNTHNHYKSPKLGDRNSYIIYQNNIQRNENTLSEITEVQNFTPNINTRDSINCRSSENNSYQNSNNGFSSIGDRSDENIVNHNSHNLNSNTELEINNNNNILIGSKINSNLNVFNPIVEKKIFGHSTNDYKPKRIGSTYSFLHYENYPYVIIGPQCNI
jgi:ABC-type lipoprotein release transport system permease subunit